MFFRTTVPHCDPDCYQCSTTIYTRKFRTNKGRHPMCARFEMPLQVFKEIVYIYIYIYWRWVCVNRKAWVLCWNFRLPIGRGWLVFLLLSWYLEIWDYYHFTFQGHRDWEFSVQHLATTISSFPYMSSIYTDCSFLQKIATTEVVPRKRRFT